MEPYLINEKEKPWSLVDFHFGKPLGRGQFGRVFLAKEVRTVYQHLVAIKIMSKSFMIKNRTTENLKRELEFQLSLKHPNVIGFYGWFHDDKNIFFILEFAPGGNLYKLIKSKERVEEQIAATYVLQVCWALEYVHSKNIIHRDLKPENILIGSFGEIKIADFGWANTKNDLNIQDDDVCRSLVGTLDYLCPEIITREKHSEKIDIWCLGVLCFELLSGHTPFCCENQVETLERIKKIKYKFPIWFDDDSKELISKILIYDPTKRLNISQIKNTKWIRKNANQDNSYMKFFECD